MFENCGHKKGRIANEKKHQTRPNLRGHKDRIIFDGEKRIRPTRKQSTKKGATGKKRVSQIRPKTSLHTEYWNKRKRCGGRVGNKKNKCGAEHHFNVMSYDEWGKNTKKQTGYHRQDHTGGKHPKG